MYISNSGKSRFSNKITITDTCHNYIDKKRKNGYGNFKYEGITYSAHRFSYMIHKGEITKGLFVLHTCDNRLCVNPDHLYVGTVQDNANDRVKRGRGAIGYTHGIGGNNGRFGQESGGKLSWNEVLQVRFLGIGPKKLSQKTIAKKYNMTQSVISLILNNKTRMVA